MRSSSLACLSWSLVAAAALLACGGSQPAATTPAGETAASGETAAEAPASPAPGELVWSDSMPTKDKGVFMKQKVMPAMTKVFQAHDGKEFADFSCKTCHGPSMKPKPADFLPTLHFKGGKLVEAETEAEMVKFMHDSVTPTMADLFGKKPYDPATNEGFGCKGCHNIEM
jgi:hypothetical protein